MGTMLLYYIGFFLLRADPMDAGITQNLRYLVIGIGRKVTLRCDQDLGHNYMYWYRKDPGLGLRLIHYSTNVNLIDKGELSDGYNASRTEKPFFLLILESTNKNQTSEYFCASSLTTVQQSFYPDLVELSWWVNGQETKVGVSTDLQPSKEQPNSTFSKYSLSSRLRVSAPFWRNPKNSFRCQNLPGQFYFQANFTYSPCSSPLKSAEWVRGGGAVIGVWGGLLDYLVIERSPIDDFLSLSCSPSCCANTGQLYFGVGTRLTVLDDLNKVTPPKVTVFQPSEEEIEEKGKATLVCLATGFYPDFVELSWWVNGQETKVGVSTDLQPSKEQPNSNFSKYSLSSRLRVSAPFWRNPKNSFRCQALFHGISEDEPWTSNMSKPITQNVSDQIWGKADCGVTSESYQHSIQSATFLYEILLGKAMLYGLLVSALVWRTMAKKKYS
ncbi:T cell receptor beta chain MC.7.G5-like [Phascolarctos cinereus]